MREIKLYEKECVTCNTVFETKYTFQRFCSGKCRYKDPNRREYRRDYNSERRQRNLAFIRRVKTFYGCSECGYKGHPSALQFDHLDRSQKSFELSRGHLRAMGQVKEEIRKCRILCANCHAIHTDNQRQSGEITYDRQIKEGL